MKTSPSEVDVAIYACTDETIIITTNSYSYIASYITTSRQPDRLTQTT